MSIPAIILALYFSLELLLQAYKHGKPKEHLVYNFWHMAIHMGIVIPLLWWGGFFAVKP